MNELINVQMNENQEPIVSSRELHEFLQVATPYHKWMPRMCEYGFVGNVDYVVMDIFVPNSNGGKQSKIDHHLKIDMAKEISMIQRTKRGEQA